MFFSSISFGQKVDNKLNKQIIIPQGTTAMLISFDASQVYWTPSLFANTNTNTEANTITY